MFGGTDLIFSYNLQGRSKQPFFRQDSRIVGSNFVQVTTRPRDRFLEKIDKTLAEVRAMPRY